MDFSKFCDNCYQPLDECVCPISQEEYEDTNLIIKRLNMNKKYAVLSLSGGMDSSTLLLHLLKEGYEVFCVSFNYNQKHKIELERAKQLVDYLKLNAYYDNHYPNLTHQIITIDGWSNNLNSALVEGGEEIPTGYYENDNMSKTVVENRNKIFSSFIQSIALSISNKNNNECVIAMGIHAGDHAIYADCRQEFRDADFYAFRIGNFNSERVNIYTPYLHTDKFGILKDGVECCKKLGLDFNEVYKRTITSYSPTEDGKSNGYTGSDVERILAFNQLGLIDPVEYVDGWNKVLTYALKEEADYGKNK